MSNQSKSSFAAASLLLSAVALAQLPSSGLARRVREAPDGDARILAARPLADLSALAYGSLDEAGKRAVQQPAYFESELVVTDEVTGFRAAVFHSKIEPLTVVAFAGTAASSKELQLFVFSLLAARNGTKGGAPVALPADWKTGVELAAWRKPLQFEQAESLVVHLIGKALVAGTRRSFLLTGHSLGGALAIHTGMLLGIDAIAFNAPAINPALFADVPSKNRASHKDGPWYLALQSSIPKDSTPHWYSVSADLVGSISRKTYGSGTAADLFGRKQGAAIVEVISVPTGCDLDLLCHTLDYFRRDDVGLIRRVLERPENLQPFLDELVLPPEKRKE